DRIEWFWGDERCVPVDDPRSNVRLARESLLGPRGIAAVRIHPPPVELVRPEAIADAYARALAALLEAEPVFDAVLLGVGGDGHVASLMPGCRALSASAPVAAVALEEVTAEPHVARITVTPPVLGGARRRRPLDRDLGREAVLDTHRLARTRAELLRERHEDVAGHVTADAHPPAAVGATALRHLDVEGVEPQGVHDRRAQLRHDVAR